MGDNRLFHFSPGTVQSLLLLVYSKDVITDLTHVYREVVFGVK